MAQRWHIEISLEGQDLTGAEAVQTRHAIEDQIEAAEIGDVIGGGCQVDGSAMDFELAVTDAAAAKDFLDAFLEHCELTDCTTITVSHG